MNNQVKLTAPDISCNHCAMTIKRELAAVEGISHVEVDVPTKSIRLEYDTLANLEHAKAVLADIGYPVAQPQA